jgi:protein-disulfide isomerase
MSADKLSLLLDRLATGAIIVTLSTITGISVLDLVQSRQRAQPALRPSDLLHNDGPGPGRRISLAGLPTRGDQSAPIGLVEFSDFQCRYCAVFSREILPNLVRDYVASGRLLVAFHDLPSASARDSRSFKSSVLAECARRQGKFWETHDWLFDHGTSSSAVGDISLPPSIILNRTEFDSCSNNSGPREVARRRTFGAAEGITGTPTLVIGRLTRRGWLTITDVVKGMRPYEDFQRRIDAGLAGSANVNSPSLQ